METRSATGRLRRAGPPFRPSYEGWKRVRHERETSGITTFRPSYEGWKPGTLSLFTMRKASFRPSYEGWKLWSQMGNIIYLQQLLDLPMRDGNL